MTQSHPIAKNRTARRAVAMFAGFLLAVLAAYSGGVGASVFTGDGIEAGIQSITGIGIWQGQSITEVILMIIKFVLDIILLLAMAAIIVAGIYLIVSNGDEASKDKAKNIVFYAVAGLVLILFSRTIVMIVSSIF